jgi:hypothetical protein
VARPLATPQCARPPRRLAAALLAAALALAACRATRPTARVADGHEGAPGVQGFLLGPSNLVIGLPAELEGGVEPVQEAIVSYLQLQGRSVERLALPEARAQWEAAIGAAKTSGKGLDFAGTAQVFTRRLAESRRFDAVVMPSLLLHYTRVRHRRAEWDGVERRMRVLNIPHQSAGRTDNLLARAMQGIGMRGDAPVTSLHVVVLSRDGKQVFEGRGGLDFVQEMDLENYMETFEIDVHDRADLLQDPKILREGVEIAFTPYLVPPGH